MQCRSQDGSKKLNRHLKEELMSLLVYCPQGCKRTIEYDKVPDHIKDCDGVPIEDDENKSPKAEIKDHGMSHLLFVCDSEKPQLIRYDTLKGSRLKLRLSF